MIRIVTVSDVPKIGEGVNSYFAGNKAVKGLCVNYEEFAENKLPYNSNDSYYFLFDFYKTKNANNDLVDLFQFDYKQCLQSIKDKKVICKGVIVFAYNTWDTIHLYEQFNIINKLFTEKEIGNAHCIETSHTFSRIPEKRIYVKDPDNENSFKLGNEEDFNDYGQLIGSILNSLISQENSWDSSSKELKYLHKNSLSFNEYISNLNTILKDSEFNLSTYSFIVNETNQYLIDWPFKDYYKPQNEYITGERKLDNIFKKKKDTDKDIVVNDDYLEGCNFYYLDYCINHETYITHKLKQIVSFNETAGKPVYIYNNGIWHNNEQRLLNDWHYILSTSIFFRRDLLHLEEWKLEECTGCSINCTNDCRNYRIGIYWFMHKAKTIEDYKLHGLFTYTFYQLLKPEDSKTIDKIAKKGKELYNKNRPLIETKAKETLFPYLYSEVKSFSLQATASRLINRNSAHHLISHCEPYVTFEKISDFLGWNKDGDIPARFIKTVESMRNRYRKYVNDRYTFMSQDLHNLGSVNAYLFKDIIGPLIENTLWVDGIARDEGYGYNIIPNGTSDNKDYSSIYNSWNVSSINNLVFTVNVQKNHNELSELSCNYQFETEFGNGQMKVENVNSKDLPYFLPELKNDNPDVINRKIVNDIQVTLPGSLGAHSFYSIIENHVRNLVKHKKSDSQQEPLKIKIEIKNIVESGINKIEKDMYDLTGLTKSNPINQTLRRSNELYQVELSSNLATLTDEEYKSLVTKVIQQYDLSDYDNIAKGLADIRLNAMLLSGAELKNDNPELSTCLLANRTILRENHNILKYIFFIRKPYIAVQIGRLNGIKEDRKLGFYCFNDIEAYNNYLDDKQCPFSFMITTNDIANKLRAKQKPLKLILNLEQTYITELDLWKAVCKSEHYRLFSNLTTGGGDFREIDSNKNNHFINGKKNIVYDRHGNYTSEDKPIFWEMFGKSNADFDIIDTEFRYNKDSIYYEMVFAATQQILIIDERVSGFAVDEHDKQSKKTLNYDKEDKSVFANAAAAQIDIVTHFDTFPIQPNQVKPLGIIKMNVNNELEYNNCQKKYDIVIIHRKLVDQFIKLILKVGSISDESYIDFISEMKKYCNQVYITTGSGSISDLKILAAEYKYIPYSIVEQYMRKAIMKISLLRNL